ncbi:VTT domain-containing protein [Rhodanobacter sp. MP1X3]|uniref:TVP38/TMEM64 family protein n=1 Tax=Rhodanobacter sp. MP1X3 TaxID=2723086 RepID=UPI0016206281|nr:VTT domain-containing protein [Rhodanobacter sp. MP1X3]MBB6241542.1 putative membrane protein YdjX (TVP38/TMEM64 family) [Rhodanobacter sp. MP1X3]
MNRLRASLPLILLILAGIVLFASGALDRLTPQQLVAHQSQIHAHIAAHPWLSRLVFIGLLTLTMCTGIPGTIIVILAGGFAFGVPEGTLCSSVALTLGSLILFLASRYAFGTGSRKPPAIAVKLHRGFECHPVSYTLFLRFLPILPFGAVTVGLAWLRCPLWLFIGATWLGGTITLIFETSIGAGIGTVLSQSANFSMDLFMHREVLLPSAALAVLALLPLLIERMTRRFRQPAKRID